LRLGASSRARARAKASASRADMAFTIAGVGTSAKSASLAGDPAGPR
jgi:hypothetical protein